MTSMGASEKNWSRRQPKGCAVGADRRSALEESGALPKYLEITDALREELRLEPEGERMPSERELAQRFGVSRMTLRQALEELEREGRLERIRGSGTFTRQPTVALGPFVTSFTEDMRAQGLTPSARLLGYNRTSATPDAVEALQLSPGSQVLWIERLRMADGEPRCVEVTQLPERLERLIDAGDVEQSLHELLRAGDVHPTTLTRRVRAGAAGQREARLLGVTDGAPTLEVLDVFYDAGGRPIQYARSRYRSDRYEVWTTVERRPPSGAPEA